METSICQKMQMLTSARAYVAVRGKGCETGGSDPPVLKEDLSGLKAARGEGDDVMPTIDGTESLLDVISS